jgi:hypothetical protein
LTLIIGAVALGCGSEPNEPRTPPTAERVSSLTVTLPNPVAWWSFDEQSSTTTVYDSQPLPAVASGTKSGGVTAIEGKIGRGASLNGTSGYLNIPNKAAYQMTSAMTISAWAKPTGTTGTIAGKWGTQNSYRLLLSSGKFAFSVTLSTGTVVTATASATASTTAWSHVAGVFNGTRLILYVNGAQAATASASGSLKSSTDPIRVGNSTNNANYYKGSVDELRLYNTALSAAQLNRLANGLQHRRFRAIAIDPKFTTDPTYQGKRLHEHPVLANASEDYIRWRTPDAVVQSWMEFLNAAAGERLYLPEDGSYASAVKYVEEVPYNNMSHDTECALTPGNSAATYTAEQFVAAYQAGTLPPSSDKAGDMFRLLKANNSSLSFDLVNDANGQFFHELIIMVPNDWSIGGEGLMAANPTDTSAYRTHDGIWRLDGLAANRKFSLHGVTFAVQNSNFEQFYHRAEAILRQNWAADMGGPCANGVTLDTAGYRPIQSLSELQSAYDLFSLDDYAYMNQAQVGVGHYMPNSPGGYIRTDHQRVPSAYSYWASFPNGFPYDLARVGLRVPVSCEDWGCSGAVDRDAFVWQLSKLPKAEGMTDGRNNNWWMYVSDPNYQVGRGQRPTPPVIGSSHGAIDFTLTVYLDRIGLKWIPESTSKGSYTIQKSTDRNTWSTVATVTGATATYDVSPRPTNAVDTFYRVAWNDGTTTRYSDQLGVNLGTATVVNMSAGQRPPVNPSISLLEGSNPYVRWELPTSCGPGGNAVPYAPCSLQCDSSPCMVCVANECHGGADGSGDLQSDYHQGAVRYVLEKRGSGTSFSSAWTVDRSSGESYRIRFSSADNAVASNTTVGYRVTAYPVDGTGVLGTEWGHTDVLLAVPGNATVGITGNGAGGTGGTGGAGGAGSGGKATGGTATSTGGKATGGTATSTGGKATGGTATSTGGKATGGTASSTGGSGGGSGTNPCAGLCSSPVVFTTANYQSGNLGAGAICRETTANLSGGNCSNLSSRTLTVNSTTMNCNGWSLPAKRNGGYCIQVTAGSPDYASFSTW